MRAIGTLLLLALSACSPDPALRLRLAVDPQINSEQQLLAVVDTLQLILDTPAGFDGLDELEGPLSASDVDADGVAELVLQRDLRGESALPVFRLLAGRNSDRALSASVRGLAGGQLAAIGGQSALRFDERGELDVLVPFDLLAAFRPPRVLQTSPYDGQSEVPPALSEVRVEFSKRIEVRTGGLALVFEGAAGQVAVPGGWSLQSHTVTELGRQVERSFATFSLEGCPLNAGTFRIDGGAGIRDASGAALDQDASDSGSTPFVARFTISGSPAASPCATNPEICKTDADCNGGVTGSDGLAFVCDQGKCVPAGGNCAGAPCPPGYVCQQDGSAGQAFCVQRCTAGSCEQGSICDQQSGICVPCTDPNCVSTADCKQLCEQHCKNSQGVDPACFEDCLKQCG